MLISIITVTRNDFEGLLKTINSINEIGEQFKTYFEHLIIDGLSTDETNDYLKKYIVNPIVLTTVISEKDGGIYDAMNKGVFFSKGQYCFFLNSGDVIDDNVDFLDIFSEIEKNIKDSSSCGIALNVKMCNGERVYEVKSRQVHKYRLRMPTVHQGILYKTQYLISNKYDDSLKICSDFKSVVTALDLNLFFKPVNQHFTILTYGGISSQKPFSLLKESLTIVKNSSLSIFYKLSSALFIVTNVMLFQLYFKTLSLFSKKI